MSNTVTVFYKRAQDIRFDVKDKSGNEHAVIIKGANALIRNPDGTVMKSAAIPFGKDAYGITPNVDAELWAEVEKQYGGMSIFKLGVIRASAPKDEEAVKKEIRKVEKTDDPIEPAPEGTDIETKPAKGGRKKK